MESGGRRTGEMKARDVDTAMSIAAVVFVILCFLFLPGREAKDMVMIGCFIAAPTKFISIARWLDIVKNGRSRE
jgi:hypothetical protein